MTAPRTHQRPRRSSAAIATASLVAASLAPGQPGGQADGADAMVFHAFAEADSYRRIVRDVDQSARTSIEQQLPFKVHFDELGPHTLFVAFRARKPIGLVYLRSEEAEWGLAEISWALTLDLRVLGFQFLRGRSQHLDELEASPFAASLVGQDLARITGALAAAAEADLALVPAGAENLARTVLRSGAKALLVTGIVWRSEIVKLQDLSMGFDAFPTAESFRRQVVDFGLGAEADQQLGMVHVMAARGRGNLCLGSVVRTEARVDGESLVLRWIVAPNLRVLRIVPLQSWARDDLRAACSELEGQQLTSPLDVDLRLRPLAQELGLVLCRLNAGKGVK